MKSVSGVGAVLPRWDYLPEEAGLAMSTLETKLGEFARKLELSFDQQRRIVVRMPARLEAEAIVRLKTSGVRESSGSLGKSYSFKTFEVVIAAYAPAYEAQRGKGAE
ncbi:MAG: hypothetical protein ACAI38_23180 [Myxococcota bacterium]|nr:hypothetical protein [Myxococcota bacterium]